MLRQVAPHGRTGPDPLQQAGEQVLRFDGLGHVVVHAGCQAGLAVRRHGVGGHGHNRQIPVLRQFAYLAGGGHAVHHRHLHVHQHHVVIGRLHLVQRHLAVFGQVHQKSGIAQQLNGHFLVELVVFHQQNPRALDDGQRLLGGAGSIHRLAHAGRGVAQHAHHTVKQQRRIDRLDQHIFNARVFSALEHFLAAVARDQHHARQRGERPFADFFGQLGAIHHRHLPVQKQHLVGLAQGLGAVNQVHGRTA